MNTGKVIADTNVVSYLMKGAPLGQRYKHHLTGKLVGIVFVTVAELYYGAERNNWGEKRRKQLEEHLKNFVVLHTFYLRLIEASCAGQNQVSRIPTQALQITESTHILCAVDDADYIHQLFNDLLRAVG